MSEHEFRIVDADAKHSTFEILTGIYKGVQFQFLTIKLIDKGDHARVKFTYKVVKGSQRYARGDLDSNPDFESIIEVLLNRMLVSMAEGNNDSRRNDTKEPDYV